MKTPLRIALETAAAMSTLFSSPVIYASRGSCRPRTLTAAERQAGERVSARLRPRLPPGGCDRALTHNARYPSVPRRGRSAGPSRGWQECLLRDHPRASRSVTRSGQADARVAGGLSVKKQFECTARSVRTASRNERHPSIPAAAGPPQPLSKTAAGIEPSRSPAAAANILPRFPHTISLRQRRFLSGESRD